MNNLPKLIKNEVQITEPVIREKINKSSDYVPIYLPQKQLRIAECFDRLGCKTKTIERGGSPLSKLLNITEIEYFEPPKTTIIKKPTLYTYRGSERNYYTRKMLSYLFNAFSDLTSYSQRQDFKQCSERFLA
jgi:hypothetical protein